MYILVWEFWGGMISIVSMGIIRCPLLMVSQSKPLNNNQLVIHSQVSVNWSNWQGMLLLLLLLLLLWLIEVLAPLYSDRRIVTSPCLRIITRFWNDWLDFDSWLLGGLRLTVKSRQLKTYTVPWPSIGSKLELCRPVNCYTTHEFGKRQ